MTQNGYGVSDTSRLSEIRQIRSITLTQNLQYQKNRIFATVL